MAKPVYVMYQVGNSLIMKITSIRILELISNLEIVTNLQEIQSIKIRLDHAILLLLIKIFKKVIVGMEQLLIRMQLRILVEE